MTDTGTPVPSFPVAYMQRMVEVSGNSTKVCCGECRYRNVNCVDMEIGVQIIIISVLIGIWFGAMIAFLVVRLLGMPNAKPRSFMNFFLSRLPFVRKYWCSENVEIVEVSRSKRRRGAIEAFNNDIVSVESFDSTCFDVERGYYRDRSNRPDDENEGIDETCYANVTVHTF
ncbi:b39 [Murid betaherpesvirus 8]|uniref:B39 n=2 Tax=Rat cytomegalovirus (isolate England) TaxID=1261657 RepID=K7XQW4_RCMVE|nr:e39 [Murid betaherpesvirus 8]AKE44216.1 a39 [Rat cytomegalovirus ALL-03]AFX83361.1 e39 [Murid betaherpesvirus 8]AKB93241.1 b39 [Murid betaherpesvirus 8]WEG71833.1 membrane protein m39 [Murid betaherpesvirus 8]WPH24956.1 b39 [Murid betaherpesvirus 8]